MKETKIYLYLDIDGVLATTHQYYTNRKKWHPKYDCYRFDEKCVKVLNQIIEKYNPIIVLTSDWKLKYTIESLNDIFKMNNVKSTVTDITSDLWNSKYFSLQELEECRAKEILEYIINHNIKEYVVIDDLNLSRWFPENFVHTPRSNEGIKQSGVKDKIFKILNKYTKNE